MISPRRIGALGVALTVVAFLGCSDNDPVGPQGQGPELGTQFVPPDGKGPPDGGESAGNNLSFPVIWAEGVQKALRGTMGEYSLEGAYELVDGYRAYVQKDALNEWQAESVTPDDAVDVSWIDWGDNLESVDWYLRSQVRTEVVLIQDLPDPMLEFEMAYVSGLGMDEVWGLKAADEDPPVPQMGTGMQATVYSPCARLTIQKLLVDREDPALEGLTWDPGQGWTGPALINGPIFNGAVHEAQDGPGYYNAEINVKGKIIYGYTWNVRNLNEGAGDYRVTFSFDLQCGTGIDLNTFFTDAQILVPEEEETEDFLELFAEEGTGGGATAVLDVENNLTYIDVRILPKKGGGNKPAKNTGGNNGGPPKGGNH